MGPRTVLVHRDHLLLVGLRPALAGAGLHIVAHLTSPVELAEALVALEPEVLVTDLSLDGRDLLPAVSEAVRRLPGLRVVVLSPCLDRQAVRAALAAGARGVLGVHDGDAAVLARKVGAVLAGAVIVETGPEATTHRCALDGRGSERAGRETGGAD